MELISSNWRDIDRYYRGTWVKFREHGDILHHIHEVNQNEIRGTDENNEHFRVTLSDAVPYHLDYVLPHRALFQHADRAILLQRIPARQYHRGVCSGNTRFLDIVTGNVLDFDLPLLRAFVNKQQYRTLQSCLDKPYKGARAKAWALDDRTAYVASGDIHVIMMDNKEIAKVDLKARVIRANPLFRVELTKLVALGATNTGEPCHVTCI